ncbi:PTS sugar transporter subunit IIA [Ensifer sp. SSB1]|uniref:PTS sugar transporter subunit IIA n=1 Tax=Ensifer sp. SSB1 TaxID=2795385 RepID=UPI001A4E28A8|nr:PTS sugar transporter subunit IIA [Ensifer sp. SSB1]MBK5565457.1 PTS sugar transporter subunit IIA [Ensifer sp. SSB1]
MNDDLCIERDFLLGISAKDARSVLQVIASHLAERTGVASSVIFGGLMEREALGSTGFGGGFALPHALVSDLQIPARVLVTLREPIDFNASDDEAVDVFLAVVWPQEHPDRFLQHLAKHCRLFRSRKLLASLRGARSEAEASILVSGHTGIGEPATQLSPTAPTGSLRA